MGRASRFHAEALFDFLLDVLQKLLRNGLRVFALAPVAALREHFLQSCVELLGVPRKVPEILEFCMVALCGLLDLIRLFQRVLHQAAEIFTICIDAREIFRRVVHPLAV